LREQAAAKTAHFIAQPLAQGCLINGKALQPSDVAILVRSASQAAVIKQALSAEGVNSVYLAKDSVLQSAEAASFLQLLQAVAEPFDHSLGLTALAGELICENAQAIAVLQSDVEAVALLQQRFITAQQRWQKHGFIAMWQQVLQQFDIAEKILQQPEGERRITNLQQLAEIFQQLDVNDLALWQKLEMFQRTIQEAVDDDEHQKLRLESEANLVQIVTIHKSKGLEYPLVCCPFLFDAGKNFPSAFDIVFDKEAQQRQLYWQSPSMIKQQLQNEAFAEDIRLLYVALTRAAYHFNCCWGAVKSVDKTALYHLLYGRKNSLKTMNDVSFWNVFDDFSGFTFDPQQVLENNTIKKPQKGLADEPASLSARRFTRSSTREFVARSYSALLNHASSASITQAEQNVRERDEEAASVLVLPEPEFNQDIFHFPKGSDAGNFMHQILEDVSFNGGDGDIDEVVRLNLSHYGFDEALWQEVINDHLRICLDKKLDPKSVSLAQLSDTAICKEMGFYMQADAHQGHVFKDILSQYRIERAEQLAAADVVMGNTEKMPSFSAVKGLFKGFIDLVFEHEGQYYVLDYKSNFLGFEVADYAMSAMHDAIESHFYDLQYLIYIAALQRHLKQRLADYDYDRHIGGAFYLFLRGMNANNNNGIYFVKPAGHIIDQLETLFAGHRYE
ncbi:MAG: PD-(D/E)XK nuclease family protein, partial [Pseudomonadales bacterium]|nr:PD-(D/E)XK nuclease family protein [Pseudomonadales bacterium]